MCGTLAPAVISAFNQSKTTDPNRQTIRVHGCIDGRTIRSRDSGSPGTRYRLSGPNTLLTTLKEHNGHDDAIEGTIPVADEKSYKVGKEKTFGKSRVYGTASASTDTGEPKGPEDPVIDVTSIEHHDRRCLRK
jgi:hypothetical protein